MQTGSFAAVQTRPSVGVQPALFLICLLVWTLTNMDQSLFGYAIPGILTEFHLPLEAAGTILTVSFLLSAALIVPAGIVADRYGRGITLVVLLVLSAIMVALQGAATGIVMLTMFRALGFGLSGGLAPITNTMVIETTSPRYRGIAIGVLQCGYPLGWLLASLFAAPLLVSHGWRAICLIALGIVPLVLPVAYQLHRSGALWPRSARSSVPKASRSGAGSLGRLFAADCRRNSIATIAIFFAFGGAYAGSAFFFPTFFTQARGYTPAAAASLVGMSNGIAVFGYIGAALAGEFLLTRRNIFSIWCLCGAAALLGLLWLSAGPVQDLLWYGATAGLFFGSQAVMPVLVAELFPADIRATGLAVCASAPLFLGFALFPSVVPVIVAHLGWQSGLSVMVVPLLVAAGLIACLLPNRASGLAID